MFICLGFDPICVAVVSTLLRSKIPMAWGTTTDSLTIEINPFLYAREVKQLTLKDLDSYLIPQHLINKTSMLYIIVLALL